MSREPRWPVRKVHIHWRKTLIRVPHWARNWIWTAAQTSQANEPLRWILPLCKNGEAFADDCQVSLVEVAKGGRRCRTGDGRVNKLACVTPLLNRYLCYAGQRLAGLIKRRYPPLRKPPHGQALSDPFVSAPGQRGPRAIAFAI